MNDLRKHQLIAFSSFIVLAGVLFYLTYNTFVLKDRQYQLREKELLKEFYRGHVNNDNIYPGGYLIVSKYIEANICQLEELYKRKGSLQGKYTDSLLQGLFRELRDKNPMDSLFRSIRQKYGLDEKLRYLMVVNSIAVRFGQGLIVPVYQQQVRYPFLNQQYQSNVGYVVGGDLKSPLPQNQVTSLYLSSAIPYSYDITFTFYADSEDRKLNIFKSALPVLLLALFALTATIYIYYVTFRNWIRQKKLTEMKSDFINSITHEYNTPIATILVANKNLQVEKVYQNKRNITELTEIIARQASRLQNLFSQVLDITQMDSNLEKEQAGLDTFLKETIKDYQFKTSGQKISIQLAATQADYRVYLNKFWVTTMLLNIFENAVKYNDSEEKRIDISLHSSEDEHLLKIADNGIGMEEHIVQNIFDKFYRGNKKSAGHAGGLGLGLYYTQQCIQVHGWKMTVSSIPGKGTKFTIIIPKLL